MSVKKARSECEGRFDVVALIYSKKGKLLSYGGSTNRKTHPLMKRLGKQVGQPFKETLHAEVRAVTRLKGGKPHTLHLYRLGKKDTYLPIDPCAICSLLLEQIDIKQVVINGGTSYAL